MGNPCCSSGKGYLTKLVQHGRSRSGNTGVADRHKEDRLTVFFSSLQNRCIVSEKLLARDSVYRSNLLLVFAQMWHSTTPYDHRGNMKPRSGNEIIQTTKESILWKTQANFFFEFSKCSLFRAFSWINTATGKRPLTSMIFQTSRSFGEDDRGTGVQGIAKTVEPALSSVINDGKSHCSPPEISGIETVF